MNTSEPSPVVSAPPKRSWRRHSDEFRRRVVEVARQPNTSVAAVALANGLNANMLRRWVREAERVDGSRAGAPVRADAGRPAFVQLPMPISPTARSPTTVEDPPVSGVGVLVEIQRNGATVRATLPLDSRSAAWLREVTA